MCLIIDILVILPQYIIAGAAVFGARAGWQEWRSQLKGQTEFDAAVKSMVGLRKLEGEFSNARRPLIEISADQDSTPAYS